MGKRLRGDLSISRQSKEDDILDGISFGSFIQSATLILRTTGVSQGMHCYFTKRPGQFRELYFRASPGIC